VRNGDRGRIDERVDVYLIQLGLLTSFESEQRDVVLQNAFFPEYLVFRQVQYELTALVNRNHALFYDVQRIRRLPLVNYSLIPYRLDHSEKVGQFA